MALRLDSQNVRILGTSAKSIDNAEDCDKFSAMLGLPVEKPEKNLFDLDYVGIKASQFSFNRLQKADPVLGVDMASTGEVGCLGEDTSCAVLKSMLSVGYKIPQHSVLLSMGNAKQKADLLDATKILKKKGLNLCHGRLFKVSCGKRN